MSTIAEKTLQNLLDVTPARLKEFAHKLDESRKALVEAKEHRASSQLADVFKALPCNPEHVEFGERLREVLDQRIAMLQAEQAFALAWLRLVGTGDAAGRVH